MTLEPELRCENVSLTFSQTRKSAPKNGIFDVSFTLKPGDCLGLIGPNGAGKSTLLRVLAGIYLPTKGRVFSNGKVTLIADLMASLEPEFSGYKNVELLMAYWGIPFRERDKVLKDVLAFTELEPEMSNRVTNFSSGMKLQLAFALATFSKPDILLIDEIIGTGDEYFQEKATERISSLLPETILVMASHISPILERNCNIGLVMAEGRMHLLSSIEEALAEKLG